MAQVEKDDKFGGPRGPVTLDGLFGEGSWLGVRHIVADAGWDAACPSGTRFSSETADVPVARLGSRRSRPAGPGRAGLEGALGLLLGSGIDCDLRVPLDKPAPQPGPAGGGRSCELPGVGCVLRDGGEFVPANWRCLGV
jgi:hypothetical protein